MQGRNKSREDENGRYILLQVAGAIFSQQLGMPQMLDLHSRLILFAINWSAHGATVNRSAVTIEKHFEIIILSFRECWTSSSLGNAINKRNWSTLVNATTSACTKDASIPEDQDSINQRSYRLLQAYSIQMRFIFLFNAVLNVKSLKKIIKKPLILNIVLLCLCFLLVLCCQSHLSYRNSVLL